MKKIKLLSLATAVIMSVTMLTSCGGDDSKEKGDSGAGAESDSNANAVAVSPFNDSLYELIGSEYNTIRYIYGVPDRETNYDASCWLMYENGLTVFIDGFFPSISGEVYKDDPDFEEPSPFASCMGINVKMDMAFSGLSKDTYTLDELKTLLKVSITEEYNDYYGETIYSFIYKGLYFRLENISDKNNIAVATTYVTIYSNSRINDDGSGAITLIREGDKNAEGIKNENGVYYTYNTVQYVDPETSGEVVLPSSIRYIAKGAFKDCDKITSIVLPDNLEGIGDYAFYGMTSLKTITMPKTLLQIGAQAFENCTSLESIDLNYGLRHLGVNAFENCESLTRLRIPKTVRFSSFISLGRCDNLTDLILLSTSGTSAQPCTERSVKNVVSANSIFTAGLTGFSEVENVLMLNGARGFEKGPYYGNMAFADNIFLTDNSAEKLKQAIKAKSISLDSSTKFVSNYNVYDYLPFNSSNKAGNKTYFKDIDKLFETTDFYKVEFNGEYMIGQKSLPVEKEGVILISAMEIFDKLGMSYEQKDGGFYASGNNNTVEYNAEKKLVVNGKEYNYTAEPIMLDGSVMLEIDVFDLLEGVTHTIDNDYKIIKISK